MCCRYFLELSPELRPYLEAASRAALTNTMVAKLGRPLITSGEVRPTDIAAVLAPGATGEPAVFPMVWGFTNPKSTTPIVNARVETAAKKPLWKEAYQKHRCIIPASWYFEWEHFTDPETGKTKTGAKYSIQPESASVTFLAGLYRIEEKAGLKIPVFTILTREPGPAIRFLHDRMPVILPRELIRPWLKIDGNPDEILQKAITNVVFERGDTNTVTPFIVSLS